MQTLFVIIIISLVAAVAYAGRKLYLKSIMMRNRVHMSSIYTNITHELLTPLTVISASVERLREQEPTFSDDYDLMQLNIERMVRLLQQILETSKSLSGELKLLVAHGDVMQYIQRTALCIEPLMTKRKLEFTIDCQPESMMGWIDTDKLDKIIYNLLSNAAKYTNENGKVKLQVSTNKTYDHIIIKVIDNGIGIPKEKQKDLFRRYFDGQYRKQQTIGNGLGLALTRELVFLHGGNIECDSEEGKGTTFTVTLPINKESFTAAQIDESQKVDINTARSVILDLATRMKTTTEDSMPKPIENIDDDSYKLLVIEDNVELLMLMQQLLGQKYQVKTASNGQEGLDIINNNELDLIVSDVMMPVMDGYELTHRVKEDPNTSHLPIILLTAKTQEEDRVEALQIGADDYVTKPFKLHDLELRINNIIENRKRIQQEFSQQTAEETQEQVSAEPVSADQQFLKRALDCVYKHLDDADYDRDAFAADMGASASTLYNKLRSVTGMNVSGFIRDIRMKEAKRIALQQPDLRVSDLAYKVGFHDPKYFSTCFKKTYGVQPSEFLENLSKDQ
jgi:DNA-binding response OmpR family regulator/nitrogen-specific signal transduction histidine kinase